MLRLTNQDSILACQHFSKLTSLKIENDVPIKRKVGQIIKIDLYNGYHTYGYEINHRSVAILDIMTQNSLSLSEIMSLPRLFTIGVMDFGFETWEIIGHAELNKKQRKRPDSFIQDSINLSLKLMDDNSELYPVSFNEVQNLERVAGWYSFNVEQRVRDHFARKANITVEILRPKPPDAPHFRASTPYSPVIGTIKRIDLRDGTYVFARELQNTFFAVYDSRTEDEIPSQDVTTLPVLFTISVSLSARLGWENVGFERLQDNEHPLPKKRYLRIGSKETDFLISTDPYDPEFNVNKGTLKNTNGLEPAVMWDNYQVENRIRAFYQGNPWVF